MTIRSRRRSTMSASAPAGSASSISGKLSAASTSATIDGEDESEVISQPAPTSCIQVPTFETIVAIHRLRNSAVCSGAQAPGTARTGAGACVSVDGAGFIGERYNHARSFKLQHDLVDITPAPVLAGLERSHDGMLSRAEVLRGVPVLRLVATADVPACAAQAKMHP